MRVALLANRRSGSGEAVEVADLLAERGAEVRELKLADAGRVAESGPERVVVAGGDGSIAPAAEAAAEAGVPLAVIPIGTANDFARALELPLEAEPACELALRGTRTRKLELARMNGRPFVNVASAGLAPVAAHNASGLKRTLGPLAYAAGAIRAGLGADPVVCAVRCDDADVFAGRAWQVTVASTGAFGGGAGVEAGPGDGRLDVVVVAVGPRVALMRRALAMRCGGLERQPGVRTASARAVTIETGGPLAFNVDGELVEATDPEFTADRRAYEVVVG